MDLFRDDEIYLLELSPTCLFSVSTESTEVSMSDGGLILCFVLMNLSISWKNFHSLFGLALLPLLFLLVFNRLVFLTQLLNFSNHLFKIEIFVPLGM